MFKIFLILTLMSGIAGIAVASEMTVQINSPKVIISDIPTKISFELQNQHNALSATDTSFSIVGLQTYTDNQKKPLKNLLFNKGVAGIPDAVFSEYGYTTIKIPQIGWEKELRVIPGWLSLLPPLIAIIIALTARQVLVALFVGIWLGATLICDYNPVTGFFYSLTKYIALAPADPDKMAIIVFTLALGGLVGVITKMGGTQGIVDKFAQYASNSKRGQIITWLLGIFIFFDDYTNTLIVGNTMRPLTDKLKISREKLSYLVDSTAAPVANIAIISTWIGFEISLIGSSFQSLGINDNPYLIFIKTIPYNLYPLYTLVFGFCVAWFGRDFGPMLHAERRSLRTGQVLAPDTTPLASFDAQELVADNLVENKWYNGFIPIFVVILSTLLGLWITGSNELENSGDNLKMVGLVQYISLVIGKADSYSVLVWASFLGSLVAILMATGQKILRLEQTLAAWVGGVKAMLLAILILTMAWSIGNLCTDLKTADYIIHYSEGLLSPYFIPALSFFIASLISFATGTSFGVMAILMPIVIPIAHLVPQAYPDISAPQQQAIFLSTIASVLAGATFGDHCSPISDTTIMSSMASGADHMDHVRTQLPYAVFAGILSITVGYLPIGFGVSPLLILPLGFVIIVLSVRFLAAKVQEG